MKTLSDQLLLAAYYQAIELHLDKSFIDLLQKEVSRRNLQKQASL